MNRQQSFLSLQSCLYVIATPIGNLEELTYRIVDTLKKVDVAFCEDTRVSLKLFQHLKIKTPLYSAYENKELEAAQHIITFLEKGQNVALLSDAGYPGISDPGQKIIQQVKEKHFPIIVLNGPCALIQSVVASGFPFQHFYFYGFLDAKSAKRKKELLKLENIEDVLIFYLSPHKAKETLEDLLSILGNRQICLCRELTKKFEEYIWGTIQEILSIVETLKGEMVLIVEGKEKQSKPITSDLFLRIDEKIKQGCTKNQAIKEIAKQYDVSKNELYQLYHTGGKDHE